VRAVQLEYYENYPSSLVAFDLLSVPAGLAVGLMVLAQLGTWAWVGYLAFWLLTMASVLAFACTRCYYYGKTCGAAPFGKLAALFFKKRAEEEFGVATSYKATTLLLLASFPLPILGGIASLIVGFSLYRLLLFLVLIGLTAIGFVRRPRLCSHCKQAESGRCMMAPRRSDI